ncbi:MAG: hypothetical protein KDA79_11540 [Planctomycetaceae bacterium]|nr:hypothetical protein [Planctomycetaceae bacterium]
MRTMVQIKRFLAVLCVVCVSAWSLGCGDTADTKKADTEAPATETATEDGADHADHDHEDGEEPAAADAPMDFPPAGSTTGGAADVPPPAPADNN